MKTEKTDNVDRRLLSRHANKQAEKTLVDEIMEQAGVDISEDETIDSEPSESVYKAYGVSSRSPIDQSTIKQEILEIKQKGDSGFFAPYHLVILTGYVEDHTITLYCTNYAIIIEGKHLTELRGLLVERKAKWIQQFDGKCYKMSLKELPEGTPVITEIKVRFGRE